MKKKNIGKRILCVLLALILIAAVAVWATYGNLVTTLLSIERMGDTQLFTMEFDGDYGFDTFMETGASSDGELVQFVVDELTHGLPIEFDLPDLGCTTYVATTPDGDALLGRNFDMYYSPVMMTKTEPDNGYKSFTMVNLAYIGYSEDYLPVDLGSSILTLCAPYAPMDGMNEKGLAVSVMLIDTVPTDQDTDKLDVTTSSAIRMLLDKAATVDEAIALLENVDMHASANSCYHFLIGDANGDSAVVEYINDEISVLKGEKISTNFLLTPGEYEFGGGYDRYDIVKAELERTGGIMTEEEAMHTLELAQNISEGPDDDSTTQWSCVYNLDKQTVDICVGADFETVYSFDLN